MDAPTRSGWSLLPVFDDPASPLPMAPSSPYAALVVAENFGEIGRDVRDHICVQLALSGCRLVDFHGVGSDLAEDSFDEYAVILGLALDGDAELGIEFAKHWDGLIGESPAARWKTYDGAITVSTTEGRHEYEVGDIDDSLAGSIAMMVQWTPAPPEHVLAVPLDHSSELALQEALGAAGVTWSALP